MYAPTKIAQAFYAAPSLSPSAPSPAVGATLGVGTGVGIVHPMGGPNITMTPYEIYLDFRTAPEGALGVAGSLWESGVYISSEVAPAYGAGYAVGTVINNLIENYDPSLEDTIGGTVSGMASDIEDAGTELMRGDYEASFDSLFGGGSPVLPEDSGNDFGVSQPMAFWFVAACQ